MAASDYLKKFRDGASGKSEDDKSEPGKPEKPEAMSRKVKLTDDEMGALKGTQPGADVVCEVHGTMESDGNLRIMSIAPMGGAENYGGPDQMGMAGQIAQRVQPNVQISPS